MSRRRCAAGLLPVFGAALGLFLLPVAGRSAEADDGGHDLFVERCGGCHLEGGFGTRVLARRVPEGEALLEKRANLPPVLVEAAVRNGVGSMPQIRAAELTDEQLERIAAYLGETR